MRDVALVRPEVLWALPAGALRFFVFFEDVCVVWVEDFFLCVDEVWPKTNDETASDDARSNGNVAPPPVFAHLFNHEKSARTNCLNSLFILYDETG